MGQATSMLRKKRPQDRTLRRLKFETKIDDSSQLQVEPNDVFQNLMKNQGLKHLAEKILEHLTLKDLLACRGICRSWKEFIDNEKSLWKLKLTQKFQEMLEKYPFCSSMVVSDSDEEFKFEHKTVKCTPDSDNKYDYCGISSKWRSVKLNLIGKPYCS